MAGDEEARARSVLAEMQLRISQGPTSALGIGEIVTPEEVRAAFLGLTKQFHPARFGRLAPEIQKLSNEVFLGIKAAHDHMLKVLGAAPRGGGRAMTGAVPIVQSTARGSQAIPRSDATTPQLARGTDRDTRISTPAITPTRTGTPPMGVPITSRTATGPVASTRPSGSIPAPRTPTGPNPPVAPAPTQRTTGAIPIQRPTTPAPSGTRFTPVPPGTQPGVGNGTQQIGRQPTPTANSRPITPVPPGTQPGVGTGQIPRPTTPPPAQSFNPPTSPPRSADGFNPPTVRGVATPQQSRQEMPRVGEFDEGAAFSEAAALMEQKNWTAARQALHALAARVPQSKNYRAWLCYARGREAYIAGRPDDAILEMQRALQLDPDLAHAKHALAELQRRR